MDAIALEAPLLRRQLSSAAGRADARAKAPICGMRRPALCRHDERLFGREPRPRAIRASSRRSRRRRAASRCRRAPSTTTGSARSWRSCARVTGLDAALPMNTGAEAVETAIKAARRWGYRVKGIAARPRRDHRRRRQFPRPHHDHRRVLVARPTIATASARSRRASAPCRSAISPRWSARSRRIRPPSWSSRSRARPASSCRPPGWLAGVRRLCDAHRVLLILDEVQSGLGPHRRVVRLPARERAARRARPRQGAGRRRAAGLGVRRHARADGRVHAGLARLDLRRQRAGRGRRARSACGDRRTKAWSSAAACSARTCWRGCDAIAARRSRPCAAAACGSAPRSIPPSPARARRASACSSKGVLSKETHDTVVRLAPPLVIAQADLDWALDRFEEVVRELERAPPPRGCLKEKQDHGKRSNAAHPDVPAGAFRRHLCHQSVDGPGELGERGEVAARSRAAANGAGSMRTLKDARRRRSSSCRRCRACPISSSPPMPPW